jgi:hypothetical protein
MLRIQRISNPSVINIMSGSLRSAPMSKAHLQVCRMENGGRELARKSRGYSIFICKRTFTVFCVSSICSNIIQAHLWPGTFTSVLAMNCRTYVES